MAEHTWEVHEACTRQHCPICEDGLSLCTVCGGLEGALPTDCPGMRMSHKQIDAVYAAKLDYRDGEGWVNKPAKHWEHLTKE